MNKLKKKLLGVAGLLTVASMTIFAVALPSFGAYAVSDILVSVEVAGQGFSIGITSPADNANVVHGTGTVTIGYNNSSDISLVVSGPGGEQPTAFTGAPGGQSGSVTISYTLEQGYGDYILTPRGVDLVANPQAGTPITIHYHSANGIVTNPGTEQDPITEDPEVKVEYGTEVCKVGFQAYAVDPMATPQYDITKPLLDPEYIVDLATATSPTSITVPISKAPYNLKGGLYKIIMTSYDCVTGDPIEENLDVDGEYEDGYYFYNPKGDIPPPVVPKPPNTGVIRIGGIMIAKSDLVATGIVIFTALAIAYVAFRTYRHSLLYRARR